MKIKNIVLAAIIPLALSACSRLLPLDYTNYQGSDAATIYTLNQQGNVGTIYLGSYKFNEKDACYDMVDRYQLESNFLESTGKVIVSRVKPGAQYSVSQIKNRGSYLIDSDSSFIPEAGKYYYIASGSKIVEVPANFIPDPNVSEDSVVKHYEKTPVKFWNLKKRCSRAWWHVG
ncbi:hypothetical protein [Lelliottia amnigena]|uniref:hypothetical protein n=1 Tax=Lelliottia amnigena TaxID=61646 RepID=UPI001EF9A028|nr:hypothetical protein [Lelliottia amnigena]MCG7781912.1 hypothetical protein [Lelliottia amnigena]